MQITYARLFQGTSRAILKRVAVLYCEIWKEPPWLEYFWTIEGVDKDLKALLTTSGAEFFVAYLNSEVIGFVGGYPMTRSAMRRICGNCSLDHLFKKEARAFYAAELGVSLEYRNSGIGRALASLMLQEARERGFRVVVLRTDRNAVAARVLYQSLGFRELPTRDARHHNRTYWVLDL